jgi:transposase
LKNRDPKRERLKDSGLLNPHPERVRAPWYGASDFFDPRDLVQTKYEMLRHAQMGGASKLEAANLFGMSRPTFYHSEAAFAEHGLEGLLPRQRGPKGGHKLNAAAMRFIEQRIAAEGAIGARALASQILAELGLSVHPRSIERALARKKKP